MKKNFFLVGFFLLITTTSGVVASELAANKLDDRGNWSAWDRNNSTGENISVNDSWKLVFSGQKIDDYGGRFISTDSTRMAYLNHSDKGYSLVVAGPGGKIEGKTYEDIKDDVIFSPDSTRVAYKARTGDRWIAVVDSSEGKQYDEILSIAFSPDSKRVTYLAKAGNKIAVVVDGEEKLYDNAYGLIFSPDSKHLAYYISRGGNGPYVVLDGKGMEKLGTKFVFSPDSARWAYSSVNAYFGDPVYVVLNNKNMDLGTDGSIYGLYFSPDSQRFAFDMRNGSSAYGFHKVVVDEVYGKEYQFPGVGKVFFSPDSRHVAHKAKSNGEGYFVVLDGVEGKNYSEVREPILFSPDSNHTAYAVGSNDGLHVVLDGKEGSNYTDVWSMTFSPDSKHLAYAARASRDGKDVQFIVVDGKEGQQYVRDWSGQGILYGPVFSPYGKVAYVANDGGKAEYVVVDQTRKTDPWVRLDGSSLVFDSPDAFHYLGKSETGSYLVNVKITSQPEVEACSWNETWNTDFGSMELKQSGSNVTGTYPHDEGRIQGIVSGNKLVGTWSEAPSYRPPNDAGAFEFTMAEDCKSFSGNWKYGSEGGWSGNWKGTRV